MPRTNDRKNNQLREIKITKNYFKHAEGSCLIEFGDTRVACSASVEDSVPPFLKNTDTGWVTAEYGMLPRSCETRIRRAPVSGRAQEIQRLIGRSLRSVVDMKSLGERTIKIDCDVIDADGGTRTASITGGYIALALALKKMKEQKLISANCLKDSIAAISVGISKGDALLDLDYKEDSGADIDMNVVMLGNGSFVEVQGTAEGEAFSQDQMNEMLDLARKGIDELITIQRDCIGK